MVAPHKLLLLALAGACLCSAAAAAAPTVNKHKLRGQVFGCRVPRKYFVVRGGAEPPVVTQCKRRFVSYWAVGFGETDEGSGMDPFETGAHDLAMEDAGIHQFNLVQYTSILPKEAQEISLEEARKEPGWRHGAVLECIMSEVHGARGDRVTAGVGRMMVHTKGKKDEVMGGFATEYKGHAAPDMAEKELESALEELFERRFSSKDHEMGEKNYGIVSKVVEKSFGSVMAGVCFIDYIFPYISDYPPERAEL